MTDILDGIIDERANDRKEFEDAFDNILEDSDEDKSEKGEEAKEVDKTAGEATGDAAKDQEKEATPKSDYSFSKDPLPEGDDQATGTKPKESDTPTPTDDWQKKALAIQAELDKEKQKTASWDGRIKAANEKTKVLESQVATLLSERKEKATAKTAAQDLSDKEKIELFKENFPELGDFADIIERRLDTATKVEEVPAKVEPEKPQAPAEVTSENKELDHFAAIRKDHPELEELVKTGVLETWINQQPDFMRPHLQSIYDNGSSGNIINMITEFKNQTSWQSNVTVHDKTKQDKLNSMREAEGDSPGPKSEGPDKYDFQATAKEIGL